MLFHKTQNLVLFSILAAIAMFPISTGVAYSQISTNDDNDMAVDQFSLETLLDALESPQVLMEQFSIDFSRDISTFDLLGFSFGMVAYGIFIWHFYRLISRREIVSLNLNKYDTGGGKATSLVVYVVKYVIVFPLVITAWFFVYSLFMFFLAPEIKQDFVFLVVISLVVAIRIAAYYKEDLSKDLAKMIPFALLGIFLVNTSIFTLDQLAVRLTGFVPFVGKIAAFVIFAIGVEVVLRALFLIKRKIIPAVEAKVEEHIEKTIDEKMKIKIEQLEKNQKKLEENLENKIEKTEDKLEEKIVETEKKVDKTKDKIDEKIEQTEEKIETTMTKSEEKTKEKNQDANNDKTQKMK